MDFCMGIDPVRRRSKWGNWLTYSANYAGQRFSPLAQLTPANVAYLRVKWARQFENRRTEVSPLVADGVM
jgi:quinohemoprotein ethanol dehydrogenase